MFGIKERDVRARAQTASNAKTESLRQIVTENVEPGSIVSTNEWAAYGLLNRDGFRHGAVRHGRKEYMRIDWRLKTAHNIISRENFWSLLKRAVLSTHIYGLFWHMDKYLSKFAFRSNHRAKENTMFDLLIGAV